jgi:hypothetical protein
MFERFTERARQVVVLAQEEARILKHNYIGTEHLLLGLLREETGLAASVLDANDVTVERVRAAVVQIVGSGEEVTSGQIPFTPRSKKVLELSLRAAQERGHNYIGTGHILLGIAAENQGVASRVLLEFGLDSARLVDEVQSLMETGVEELPGEPRAAMSPGAAFTSLERTADYVLTARKVDPLVHGSDAAVLAYAAGALNALRDAGLVPNEVAQDWLARLLRPREGDQPSEQEFTGRALVRVVAAPTQPDDGFRVLGADLYRDGLIARVHVPDGGALPVSIDVADSAGTSYRPAGPVEWHGSDGVLGEAAFVPAVPAGASDLTVRAVFKDGSTAETAIPL